MKKNGTKNIHIFCLGAILASTSLAHGAELSWNGFGSAYYGQAFNSELMPPNFIDKHANFTHFSLMGLNLGASVEDNVSFAAQFLALGRGLGNTDSFGVLAQWAYLNYQPTPETSLRLGRQLFPSLLASEFVRVGYLLPFREIPNLVFNLSPFTRFDGVSVSQAFRTGIGKFTLGLFGGTPLLDVNTLQLADSGLAFKFADLVGGQMILDGDGWRVRAQASRFFSELRTSAPSFDNRGVEQNYSVGYRYDRSNIVSWGEYILVRTPDGTPSMVGGTYAQRAYAYYLLGGYRLGKWMPRYTFAKASSSYNLLTAPNGTTTTHTLGVNYQAGDRTVVKVEYERDFIPSPGGGSYFVTQPPGATVTSGGAFYAGVDFIF